MNSTPAAERLLSIAEVAARTTFSRAHIYDMVKHGRFAPPIRISANRVAWPESTVSGWIATKIAQAA